MTFDPCPHQITELALRAMRVVRELRGDPEEQNATTLMKEAVMLFRIPPVWTRGMNSKTADHLPGPYEMGRAPMQIQNAQIGKIAKKLLEHKQVCPKCGKKSMEIFDICRSCSDFKAGFRSEWRCIGIRDETGKIVDAGCGQKVKTDKFMGQWFKEFADADPEFKDLIDSTGMLSKQEMGIKTITDEGLK